MHYEIKTVTAPAQLDPVLELCRRVLGEDVCDRSPYTREEWVERVETLSDLLLYAEAEGRPVAAVLGRAESMESLVMGFVACEESCRRQGITRALIERFEENARAHGFARISLGARKEAEGFYERCGYACVAHVHDQKVYMKIL